ncbi:MAG: autoinducer synthase [Rhodobacterales bacterium]|nr:MAG: autoinducer synthase [Rhodobacterales bacterium]
MIRFVYADELNDYPKLAHSMFTDRTAQFRDRLGWPVNVNDAGEERDEYDAENPLYVIWQNTDHSHGGSMRLLPTMGRTMVNDHFLHLTDGVRVESPLIWECTRFCLSRNASAQTAAALMLAGGEVMRQFGIKHYVGVFDAPMVRIYKQIGANPTVLGSAGKGRDRTSVGLWEFTDTSQQIVSKRAGISPRLMTLWFERSFGTTQRFAATA